jgi:predicted kinase
MKKIPQLLILIGPPGSGKSTFAKYLLRTEDNWFRICRDDIRLMQFTQANLTAEEESKLTTITDGMIDTLLQKGSNVVVDATHTRKQFLDHYTVKFGHLADISYKVFDLDHKTLKDRVEKRYDETGKYIPKSVLTDQIENFQRLKSSYDFTTKRRVERKSIEDLQDNSLPKAIICDLDGTLAIIANRSPYDASECEKDLLNEAVAHIIMMSHQAGDKIILFSGRTDDYKLQTERWLAKHNIPYDILAMRVAKDMRKDSVVKLEMVEKYITGQYYIRFTLDDRNQVVDMWRQQCGFNCLQVNYGDF